jgi:hypothetical protein
MWWKGTMAVCALAMAGCGTVDLGEDIVPPDLQLDEDFFFCEIQPNCLTRHGCATGMPSESGTCHAQGTTSLLLVETPAPPPECTDGVVIGGTVDPDYMANFEAVRFTVQSDPESSPILQRPLMRMSHPRQIFNEDDECAALLVEWINRGAL